MSGLDQMSSEIEPSPRSVAGLLAKARERSAEMVKDVERTQTQEHIELIKALAVGYAHSGYNAQETALRACRAAERLMQTFAELRDE